MKVRIYTNFLLFVFIQTVFFPIFLFCFHVEISESSGILQLPTELLANGSTSFGFDENEEEETVEFFSLLNSERIVLTPMQRSLVENKFQLNCFGLSFSGNDVSTPPPEEIVQ